MRCYLKNTRLRLRLVNWKPKSLFQKYKTQEFQKRSNFVWASRIQVQNLLHFPRLQHSLHTQLHRPRLPWNQLETSSRPPSQWSSGPHRCCFHLAAPTSVWTSWRMLPRHAQRALRTREISNPWPRQAHSGFPQWGTHEATPKAFGLCAVQKGPARPQSSFLSMWGKRCFFLIGLFRIHLCTVRTYFWQPHSLTEMPFGNSQKGRHPSASCCPGR